jgi:hypothetical protein
MCTSQIHQPLVTSHDVEHPHAVGRRIKAGLTLVGAATAGVLALILTSPQPLADTFELPDFPIATGDQSDLLRVLAVPVSRRTCGLKFLVPQSTYCGHI